jgi:hypothetical protein
MGAYSMSKVSDTQIARNPVMGLLSGGQRQASAC